MGPERLISTTAPRGASWVERFDAFTLFHWTTLTACLALIGAWCVAGAVLKRRDAKDNGGRERAFRRALAWAFLAWQAFATVWRVLPGNFDINESLPLHLCRFVGVIAPIAMLTMRWRWRAIVFFWGLGLSTQGMLTPMWNDGLGSVAFWLYWVGHVIIIGAAVYDIAVHRYAPRLHHLGFAVVSGVALTVGIAAFNVACGTNYCYLGRGDYAGSSVVDHLGDWPARPAIIIGGAAFVFLVMYLIALGVRRVAGAIGRTPAPAAG